MRKMLVVLLPFLLAIMSGCGQREINRGYLVTAIGFKTNNNRATIYIEAMSSGDSLEKQAEKVVIVDDGININDAYKNLKAALVKPLYFEQLGAAAFEGDTLDEGVAFLQDIPDINYGIYMVKTMDVNMLFEAETPSGILGYDIIGLIKTSHQGNNQLYQITRSKFDLPVVDFVEGRLSFENSGENK